MELPHFQEDSLMWYKHHWSGCNIIFLWRFDTYTAMKRLISSRRLAGIEKNLLSKTLQAVMKTEFPLSSLCHRLGCCDQLSTAFKLFCTFLVAVTTALELALRSTKGCKLCSCISILRMAIEYDFPTLQLLGCLKIVKF